MTRTRPRSTVRYRKLQLICAAVRGICAGASRAVLDWFLGT